MWYMEYHELYDIKFNIPWRLAIRFIIRILDAKSFMKISYFTWNIQMKTTQKSKFNIAVVSRELSFSSNNLYVAVQLRRHFSYLIWSTKSVPKVSDLCLYREKELLRSNMNDVTFKVVSFRSTHFRKQSWKPFFVIAHSSHFVLYPRQCHMVCLSMAFSA